MIEVKDKTILQCKGCNWKGGPEKLVVQDSGEPFSKLQCPQCKRLLVRYVFDSVPETIENQKGRDVLIEENATMVR